MNYDMKEVLNLGTLIVTERNDPYSFLPNKQYFWSDRRSPMPTGPFKSIHQAIEHYKSVVEGFDRNTRTIPTSLPDFPVKQEEVVKDNVIYVDFVTKRRKAR